MEVWNKVRERGSSKRNRTKKSRQNMQKPFVKKQMVVKQSQTCNITTTTRTYTRKIKRKTGETTEHTAGGTGTYVHPPHSSGMFAIEIHVVILDKI